MGRKVQGLVELKKHDFKKYAKNEADGNVKIKLLALAYVGEHANCREAAEVVGVQQNAVQGWVKKFLKQGIDGLRRRKGQGRKKWVSQENYPQIKAGILALENTQQGGRIRGSDIQKYLEEEWGIIYKMSAVYALLKTLNIVWISARSRHPNSNLQAQDSFKKTSLIMFKM